MIPKRRASSHPHRTTMRLRSVITTIASQLVACLAVYFAVHLAAPLVPGSASPATAAEKPDSTVGQTVPIPLWLQLGPVPAPLPAFHAADENGFEVEDLLVPGSLDPRLLRPRAGEAERLNADPDQSWHTAQAPDGLLILARAADQEPPVPAESYLAVYLEVDRWTKTTLELRSAHRVKAYLDGQAIALEVRDGGDAAPMPSQSMPTDADSTRTQRHSCEIKLTIGKHCLLVHTVRDPAREQAWSLAGNLTLAARDPAGSKPAALPTLTLDPTRAVTIDDILDAPRIDYLDLSPDGKLVVVTLSEYGPDGEQDHWLEIRNTHDGDLERTWRGDLGDRQASWGPLGRRLAFTTRADEKSTIWICDLDSGGANALVRDVENLGSYQWAPDGSFLIYSFTIQNEPDERKVKRVRHPADRQPAWRDRSYLMRVGVPGGATRRLTAGPLSTTGWSIAPDGQHLLFFRSEPDLTERPFSTSELWQLDLTTLAAEMLLADPWIGSAVYGPDPANIALQGSPSAFDGLGLMLAEGVQPNDYGGQLYLFNLQTRQARALSRDFSPAIADIRWSLADGLIYALCTDTQYRSLYTFDPKRERWERVLTGLDVTDDFDLARDAKLAVAYGTSVSTPNRLMAVGPA